MAGGCSVQPGVIELCGAGRKGVRVSAASGTSAELGFRWFSLQTEEFKRELKLFLVHWVFLFIFADCLAEGL